MSHKTWRLSAWSRMRSSALAGGDPEAKWDDACVNPPPGPTGATEEPDELAVLRKLRKSLQEQFAASVDPHLRDAEVRRHGFHRALRDVTVQAVGTVLGGSVLAGFAILVGLVPPDPRTIIAIVIAIGGLVGAIISLISPALQPRITRTDIALADQIQQLDALIAGLASATDHEQSGEGSTP